MNKNIKQLPKEINKTIDSYIPYWLVIQIPVNSFLFNFLHISGVYILYSKKEILYIGCSDNIGNRLRVHLSNNSSYRKEVVSIEIIRFRDYENPYGVEAELINKFKPKYNKAYPYGYSIPINFNLVEITEQIKEKVNNFVINNERSS